MTSSSGDKRSGAPPFHTGTCAGQEPSLVQAERKCFISHNICWQPFQISPPPRFPPPLDMFHGRKETADVVVEQPLLVSRLGLGSSKWKPEIGSRWAALPCNEHGGGGWGGTPAPFKEMRTHLLPPQSRRRALVLPYSRHLPAPSLLARLKSIPPPPLFGPWGDKPLGNSCMTTSLVAPQSIGRRDFAHLGH